MTNIAKKIYYSFCLEQKTTQHEILCSWPLEKKISSDTFNLGLFSKYGLSFLWTTSLFKEQ
jgi:hypothetical protein